MDYQRNFNNYHKGTTSIGRKNNNYTGIFGNINTQKYQQPYKINRNNQPIYQSGIQMYEKHENHLNNFSGIPNMIFNSMGPPINSTNKNNNNPIYIRPQSIKEKSSNYQPNTMATPNINKSYNNHVSIESINKKPQDGNTKKIETKKGFKTMVGISRKKIPMNSEHTNKDTPIEEKTKAIKKKVPPKKEKNTGNVKKKKIKSNKQKDTPTNEFENTPIKTETQTENSELGTTGKKKAETGVNFHNNEGKGKGIKRGLQKKPLDLFKEKTEPLRARKKNDPDEKEDKDIKIPCDNKINESIKQVKDIKDIKDIKETKEVDLNQEKEIIKDSEKNKIKTINLTQNYEKRISELEKKLKINTVLISQKNNKINKLQKQLETQNKRVEELENKLKSFSDEKITELNQQSEEKIEPIQKILKDSENIIKQKDEEIKNLNEKIKIINSNDVLINKLQKDIKTRNQKISQNDKEINELKIKLEKASLIIQKLEEEKNQKDKVKINIHKLEEELIQKERNYDLLNKDLIKREKNIKNAEIDFNERKRFLEQTEYSLHCQKKKLDSDKKKFEQIMQNLIKKKKDLENQIDIQMKNLNFLNSNNLKNKNLMNINNNMNMNNNINNMNMNNNINNMNMNNNINNNMNNMNMNNINNNMNNINMNNNINNNNMNNMNNMNMNINNNINKMNMNINNNNMNIMNMNNLNNMNNMNKMNFNLPLMNRNMINNMNMNNNMNINNNININNNMNNINFNNNLNNQNFNNNNNNNNSNNKGKDKLRPRKKPLPISTYIKPTLIGLQNIGATCFMNATLQCLSQTEDLTNYFLDEERSSDKIKNNNVALKNRNSLQLTPVYLELVKQLWDKYNVRKYIEPKRFMKTVEEMNPLFKLGQAGDSKDFIIFLLEQFHTELKKSLINDNNQENQMINQYDKNEAFNNFFEEFKKQISIISDIFFGVIETTNICLYCKNDYTNKRMPYPICYNYQIFNCLIFPLEEVKNYKNDLMKRNGVNIIQNNSVTLEECFYYNQKTDYFTGDNRNYCNICKQTYDSHYTSKIYSSPNVLVLILNRGKNNIYNVKLNFNEIIDITEFSTLKEGKLIYNLYAVITHYGESGPSAHFLAFCKSPIDKRWYRYNDAVVTEVKDLKKDVIDFGNPYILFYKKTN